MIPNLVAAAVALALLAQEKPKANSYKDKPLPALEADEGHWLNSEKAPSMEALKGKPVLVVFTSLF